MTRLTYTLHRIFAGIIFVGLLFAGANYYFDLGVINHHSAQGLMLLLMGVVVVWGTFFSPSRQDMREHRAARLARRSTPSTSAADRDSEP
jgi:hypothetical protein